MTDFLPLLSIVVPVRNEAGSITAFLQSVRSACDHPVQLVVVDGGSSDATAELARPLCDLLITSTKGRARQMNAGAHRAAGAILWFLHADSRLPPHADRIVRNAISQGRQQWGRFDIGLSGRHPLLRVVERMMNWRSRLSGIVTGDQGLFVTRELFDAIGGFPDIALMEDIAISRKLRPFSRPVCVKPALITSSRRWEQNGVLRTILLMWQLRLRYFFGADPDRLARSYYGDDG